MFGYVVGDVADLEDALPLIVGVLVWREQADLFCPGKAIDFLEYFKEIDGRLNMFWNGRY